MPSKEVVKSWFLKHSKPTESQFHSFFESIFFKEEIIPNTSVKDLNLLLSSKSDKEVLEAHTNASDIHVTQAEKNEWNTKIGNSSLLEYYKRDVIDDKIVNAKNEVISTLLDNPDIDINSIKELNNLINNNIGQLSTKVSFSENQSLTTAQKHQAQENIGLFNHNHDETYLKKTGGNVNNNLVLDKSGSTSNIAGSLLTIKNTSDTVGTNVGAFIDLNRNNTTNSTGETFGVVNRLVNNSSSNNEGLITSNVVARHSGSGNVEYLYSMLSKVEYKGSGNIDFLMPVNHQCFVEGTGTGVIDYVRGLSPTVKIDNPNIDVNYAQAMHPTLSLQKGNVLNAHVLYLDVDYDAVNNTEIEEDFAYIRAGNDVLPQFGDKAYFINSESELPSILKGIVMTDVTPELIENGTDATLVTKGYLKSKPQLKVYDSHLTMTSARLNQDRPDEPIGAAVINVNPNHRSMYVRMSETEWYEFPGTLI